MIKNASVAIKFPTLPINIPVKNVLFELLVVWFWNVVIGCWFSCWLMLFIVWFRGALFTWFVIVLFCWYPLYNWYKVAPPISVTMVTFCHVNKLDSTWIFIFDKVDSIFSMRSCSLSSWCKMFSFISCIFFISSVSWFKEFLNDERLLFNIFWYKSISILLRWSIASFMLFIRFSDIIDILSEFWFGSSNELIICCWFSCWLVWSSLISNSYSSFCITYASMRSVYSIGFWTLVLFISKFSKLVVLVLGLVCLVSIWVISLSESLFSWDFLIWRFGEHSFRVLLVL